jgi:hypothetical protein
MDATLREEENDCQQKRLFGEELADIGKRFELEGIACRVEKEHGGLFADLALEAKVWLDDEIDARTAKAPSQSLPLLHRKNDSEVGNGNVVAVHRVVVGVVFARLRLQMRDDLVTEEVEVDPLSRTTALATTQRCAVEAASGVKIIDGEGDMKRSEGHVVLLALILRCGARSVDDANRLAAIEALVVAAQIGIAKVRAVWTERAKGRVVSRSVVEDAIALWMVACAVVGIA